MREIKNGSKYPAVLKAAALHRSKKIGKKNSLGVKRTVAQIAEEHNVSKYTLADWRRKAGLTKPTKGQAAYAANQKKPVITLHDGTGAQVSHSKAHTATHIRINSGPLKQII